MKQQRYHLSYLWDSVAIDSDAHERLYDLSDLLGAAHDLVVVREHLRGVGKGDVSEAASDVTESADRTRITLETQALLLGELAYADDPTVFATSLATNLQTWTEVCR